MFPQYRAEKKSKRNSEEKKKSKMITFDRLNGEDIKVRKFRNYMT